MIEFCTKLTFPPTVNHLYGSKGKNRFIKTSGKNWFEAATMTIRTTPGFQMSKFSGRIRLTLWLVPPTRLKYDADNRIKAVQDALQKSGLIDDDAQIYQIQVHKFDRQQEKQAASGCWLAVRSLEDDIGILAPDWMKSS